MKKALYIHLIVAFIGMISCFAWDFVYGSSERLVIMLVSFGWYGLCAISSIDCYEQGVKDGKEGHN